MNIELFLKIWALIGPILGVVAGSIFNLYFKKITKTAEPDQELQKMKMEGKYNVAVTMLGALAHVRHGMWHIHEKKEGYDKSIEEYRKSVQKMYREIRNKSLSSLAILGDDLVQRIHELTDIIPIYLEKGSDILYNKWENKFQETKSLLHAYISNI